MRGALVAFVVLLNAGCEVKELADTLPPPTSLDFDLTPATVPVRNFLDLRVSQKNLDPSQFTWAADLGTFVPLGDEGTSIRWLAPLMPGTATISLSTSEDPELDTSVTIEVVVQPGPDAIDPVLRPDGQRTEHVVWSPDGTRFATSAGDSVRVWDAQTAAPLAGFSVDAAAGLSWSTADGTLVAQSPSGHVVRWDPADPTWQQRFEAGEEASDLAFDPGGHRLALSRIAGTQLLDANTYEPLATEPSLGGHLSWTADGFKLLVGGRLWDPVVDLASGQAGLRDPTAVHPDGLLVAGTALVAPFEAVVHDGVSGDRIAVRASAPTTADIRSFSWSPDGEHLAISCSPAYAPDETGTVLSSGNFGVEVRDASLAFVASKTFDPGLQTGGVAYSPDGSLIALGLGIGALVLDAITLETVAITEVME